MISRKRLFMASFLSRMPKTGAPSGPRPSEPTVPSRTKNIALEYSDYVPFDVKVESLYEIFASKLRAVIERKKCRDFFDLWKLSLMNMDEQRIKQVFGKKLAVKNLELQGLSQIFPGDLKETLTPYWERELGRLISRLPDMTDVLNSLRETLGFL